jgi:outer membrane protein OmpA-like peptidoglycan-associated protein
VVRVDTVVKLPSKEKPMLVLPGALFDFGKATLHTEAKMYLDRLADQLNRDYPTVEIEITGHTDNVGSAAFNKELGLRRAMSVRSYLASRGVAMSRMAVRSAGKDEPVASNATPEGRAENRRVEIRRR